MAVLIIAVLGSSLFPASTVSGAENSEAWEPLFNGQSLKGWHRVNGTASYVAVNGAIVGTTRSDSQNSFLATEESYRDFILEFEVRQDGGPANSGVQIRSSMRSDYNQGRVFGYQVEIDPTPRSWSGGFYDEQRRGWLYPGSLNPQARTAYKFGEWNHFRIEAIGTSIRTWINGLPVSYVVDEVSSEGFIALQIHSIDSPDEAGRRTSWRNIRIRETDEGSPPTETIFVRNTIANNLSEVEQAQGWRLLWDGKTTAGWRSAYRPSFPARGWKIEKGELILQAGSTGGHIVTDESFSAFELQLEFKLTPGANSGIMYFVSDRLRSDNVVVGLEYQLLDDSSNPDFVNGSITNTTLASLFGLIPRTAMPANIGIAPKLGEWQHARIVVHLDNRVEHWLNGVQVLDYVRGSADYRKRVQETIVKLLPNFGEDGSGRILLEDHGSEVRFRSIKIRGF
jgi:hypothetical protein